MEAIFGRDGDPGSLGALQMAARAVFVYGMGLVLLRLGGHRLLGRYSALDVVLGIILGSVLSRAVNGTAPMIPTLGAAAALIGVHRLLAAVSCASPAVGRVLKGRAHQVVRDGTVLPTVLGPHSVAAEDLHEAIRLAGHEPESGDVRHAWLERDGRISVIARRGPAAADGEPRPRA